MGERARAANPESKEGTPAPTPPPHLPPTPRAECSPVKRHH